MASRMERSELPLIVIAGPTASGKTALAIQLAKDFGGEIICADSRTVYRDMDVGTAKPSRIERAAIPHWGLDLVDPGQSFTAADFKQYAAEKIKDIRGRGRIPFLVGGTGLYIDTVIFDYVFAPKPRGSLRRRLDGMTIGELQEHCKNNNIVLPENVQNKRYLVRAIERKNVSPMRRESLLENTIVVGIATDNNRLRTRIGDRVEQLFLNNVVEEATLLGEKYGWASEAMTGNIYPLIRRYQLHKLSLEELKAQCVVADWHLAKRQMTWLRRNPYITWADLISAEQVLSRALATVRKL